MNIISISFIIFKQFHSKNQISHLTVYENITSNIVFSKKALDYLETKNNIIEIVKVIRRNKEKNSKIIKIIIKFELKKSDNNKNITPDIIQKISLISSKNEVFIVSSDNIYYDNDTILLLILILKLKI